MNYVKKMLWATIALFAIGASVPNQSIAGVDSLANAANDFAFKLLHSLSKDAPGKNLFFSPLSVHTALTVAYGGAQGETKTEIARALGVSDISDAVLDADYQNAMRKIAKPDSLCMLDIANALWMKRSITFKPNFVKRATGSYLSEALPLTTPEAINSWAARKTHDRIKDIVQGISDETILIITNAVYFKGSWVVKFDSSRTEPKDFHLADGRVEQALMMNLYENEKVINAGFRYFEDDGIQGLEMPYRGNRVSMCILLPKNKLGSFVETLQAERWQKLLSEFAPIQGELHGERRLRLELPKFKLETEYNLNENLKALGMQRAFSANSADFGAMADGNISIAEVAQKAFVLVNEEGTEAAAITMARCVADMAPPPPLAFIVNKPFFFMLVDKKSGLILFMGSVYDPASGS